MLPPPPLWSSTAAAKRASTATTTASPRTHPHPHPYHSGDQDDEGVTFSSEGQHLTTTVDPWFWQRSAPSPHPTRSLVTCPIPPLLSSPG
jgi:hypothetical protein